MEICMSNVLLTSGSPLALKYKVDSYETAGRYSSTASTAVCYEQIFLEEPDPLPETEDWTNFITSFDPTLYDAFGMTAFVTSTIADFSGGTLPGGVFRAVESTSSGYPLQGLGGYETIQVDGVGFIPWTVYGSSCPVEIPGVVDVAHLEFSATAKKSSQPYIDTGRWFIPAYSLTAYPTSTISSWTYVSTSRTAYSAIYSASASGGNSALASSRLMSGLSEAEQAQIVESGFMFGGYYASALASSYNDSSVLTWSNQYHQGSSVRKRSASGSSVESGSAYTATASVSAKKIYGGTSLIESAFDVLRPTASSVSETSLTGRTYYASATASGGIPVIAGSYTGEVSAAVGLYNDFQSMNASGMRHGGMPRSAWSAGLCYDTPVGCALSGILELYRKTGTAMESSIIGSSVGE